MNSRQGNVFWFILLTEWGTFMIYPPAVLISVLLTGVGALSSMLISTFGSKIGIEAPADVSGLSFGIAFAVSIGVSVFRVYNQCIKKSIYFE